MMATTWTATKMSAADGCGKGGNTSKAISEFKRGPRACGDVGDKNFEGPVRTRQAGITTMTPHQKKIGPTVQLHSNHTHFRNTPSHTQTVPASRGSVSGRRRSAISLAKHIQKMPWTMKQNAHSVRLARSHPSGLMEMISKGKW